MNLAIEYGAPPSDLESGKTSRGYTLLQKQWRKKTSRSVTSDVWDVADGGSTTSGGGAHGEMSALRYEPQPGDNLDEEY